MPPDCAGVFAVAPVADLALSFVPSVCPVQSNANQDSLFLRAVLISRAFFLCISYIGANVIHKKHGNRGKRTN